MADPLAGLTYVTHHNPNCPSPYKVIVGCCPQPIYAWPPGWYIQVNHPDCVIEYGQTFEEAPDAGVLDLLREARDQLADGFESDDPLEADHSRAAKELVGRINVVLNR